MTTSINTPTLSNATSSSVPGRLSRTTRDATNSDVRWPELLEKFRSTQEKARRRNERLLRGESAEAPQSESEAGRGSRGRGSSDLLLRGFAGGAGARPASALSGSGVRPGSAQSGGFREIGMAAGRGGSGGGGGQAGGQQGNVAQGGLVAKTEEAGGAKGHKSRHSLASFGRLTSGIGKGASKDRVGEASRKK